MKDILIISARGVEVVTGGLFFPSSLRTIFGRSPGPGAETTLIVGALASRGGDPRERALVTVCI